MPEPLGGAAVQLRPLSAPLQAPGRAGAPPAAVPPYRGGLPTATRQEVQGPI